MKFALTASLACFLLAPLSVFAQTPEESLSRCLADSTTGRDRKDLARWVFFAMAAHPEIKQYAAPSIVSATEETDKLMASIFTRLLADSCLKQTQAAFKLGGPIAVQKAFETLGQLAMQELMSDTRVNVSMGAFQTYLDQGTLGKALGGN